MLELLSIALTLTASSAQADANDHMVCRTTGNFSWGCRVAQPNVSPRLEYQGEEVGTSYKVEYLLDCPGHDMNLRLSAGENEVVLNQSAATDLAIVEGDTPLKIVDPDPRRTRRLIFRGQCQFKTTSVTKTPSANAREAWGQAAIAQAKTLRHVLALYLLATDYEAISSWNNTRLEQLRDRLELLVDRFPKVVHYKVLLRTVNSALEGAPSPDPDQDIADAAKQLALEYREELDTELAVAENMTARFQHFKLAVQQDLQDALNEVGEVAQ